MSSSQVGRLTSLIEEEILSLRLKPGDKLDEARLAQRFGTSRTPVREALRQLSANGLIEIRPNKGAVVAKLGMRELLELLEVLAELEGACGRLAAKSCGQSDIDQIFSALEVCRHEASANNIDGYRLANEVFHDAISNASHNSYLIHLTRNTRIRVATYRRLSFEQKNRLKQSIEDHEMIAFAIKDSLPEETDRLLQLHILNVGNEMRNFISVTASAGWENPTDKAASERFAETRELQSVPVK